MLTAAQLIKRANDIAGGPAYETQGLDGLNIILGSLCEDYDFALARGTYNFNFNPGLSTLFGSGPYNLPLDYLRTSGSSGAEGQTKSAWFLYPAPSFPNGQPMELVPVDLGKFDQYPQLDAQGIPSVIATDMGGPLTQRITLVTTATTTAGSAVIIPVGTPAVGQGIAGEGIVPGSIVDTVATTLAINAQLNSSVTLTLVDTTAGVRPGDAITGSANIPNDTVVVSVDSATQITMNQAATASTVGQIALTIAYQTPVVTLSQAATATADAASVFFGIVPVCYVYPPPIGSYPVTIRYQRKMPAMFDMGQVPWFPSDDVLIDCLTAQQMRITADTRMTEFEAMARARLQRYADLVDDKTNRAQTIQMDPSRYGRSTGRGLRITKVAGW